ncbi:metal ABC transporter ATP-binding protein [Desulfohalovibrio reitneri]|uniref:metal ABC transporter ATP-binding protein n=1 Tax=Desulfohalovibrio reitneri TaxID=1307759 RepID=UPI00055745F3|nr:metal ABC transporter ATP-binding protein [Desulfohalovibrio reitneri]
MSIDVDHLSFSYDGRPVLRDVSLHLGEGEYLAVLGPNGGGKTTLLKLLVGLLRPDEGEIRLFGKPPGKVLDRVGYVPQHGEGNRAFPVRALDVALMGLHLHRPGKGDRERAMEALKRVEMADRAERLFADLSGGEAQRVLIARALASRPDLLLLDEPTSSIDPHGRFCFYEFLAGLARDTTVVVVSHDLSIMASGVTAVACVNRRLLYNPSPELTQEMLSLLYGSHEHTCPADTYMRAVTSLPDLRVREWEDA